jgi:hypothetical protein
LIPKPADFPFPLQIMWFNVMVLVCLLVQY